MTTGTGDGDAGTGPGVFIHRLGMAIAYGAVALMVAIVRRLPRRTR